MRSEVKNKWYYPFVKDWFALLLHIGYPLLILPKCCEDPVNLKMSSCVSSVPILDHLYEN